MKLQCLYLSAISRNAAGVAPVLVVVVSKRCHKICHDKPSCKHGTGTCRISFDVVAAMVGITTYIKAVLQTNVHFSPPPVLGAKTKVAEKGLNIGRYTDHLFRKVVARQATLDASNFKHRRCRFACDVLRQNLINVTKTQIPVHLKHPAINTMLDGLGQHKDTRAPVVIELKTTQYTLAEHEARYKLKCRKRPRLANGLPNSEYMVHALQAAFGVLALRQQYPNCAKEIRGVVVVAASDGAKLYPVDPTLINLMFFPAVSPEKMKKTNSLVHFKDWPENATLRQLEQDLRAKKYAFSAAKTIVKNHDLLMCSGLAFRGDHTQPDEVAVIGLYHSATIPKPHLQRLKQALVKTATMLKRQYTCKLSAFVVHPPRKVGTGFVFVRARVAK